MMRPLNNCVLIEQDYEELSKLIVLPKDKLFSGIIVAAGEGKKLPKGGIEPMDVATGDHVLFGEHSGQKVVYKDKDYLMMRATDIIGILE
jgi:chaperonin GroES